MTEIQFCDAEYDVDIDSQHNCKCELYTISSPVRSIQGSYQFVKEARGVDYPDMWFPEPAPEPIPGPRVTAVDRAERGQRLFRRT